MLLVIRIDPKDAGTVKKVEKIVRVEQVRPDMLVMQAVQKTSKLEHRLRKIKGVTDTAWIQPYLKRKGVGIAKALKTNRCVFFFDIDSTLTRGSPGTIHPRIRAILEQMRTKGIYALFATGRSMPNLYRLMKQYPISEYAIAENGGLLLGFGPDGYYKFGDKEDPAKVLSYLQDMYAIPEDMNQDMRITEVIFLKKDIELSRIKEAAKVMKAKIAIHPSKNSYHISKKGIDKGSAMIEICERLGIRDKMIIAVGDADMDVPMFKKADHSFAVGNASKLAKTSATEVLHGRFEEGIEEIMETIVQASGSHHTDGSA